MAPIQIGKDGKAVHQAHTSAAKSSDPGQGGLQKVILWAVVILIGPALLQQLYTKLTTEQVDLSDFNIVTSYDKPAIEMRDDVLRIQYCAS
mmetsp:Transcript_113524/g.294010  ORF Transcript_113524/g.294010 Transcript_113524/m.294010 type:complete len:91 (-) Transcript_113524:691-963(-)